MTYFVNCGQADQGMNVVFKLSNQLMQATKSRDVNLQTRIFILVSHSTKASDALADSISTTHSAKTTRHLRICWSGGEPLAILKFGLTEF